MSPDEKTNLEGFFPSGTNVLDELYRIRDVESTMRITERNHKAHPKLNPVEVDQLIAEEEESPRKQTMQSMRKVLFG